MKTLRERFEEKVDRSGECHEWTASKRPNGYGQFFYDGTVGYAHRYSYELHRGGIPAGLFVCHSCDNPGCVNPEHLFLGRPKDNTRDMVSKGRAATGEKNGAAKLSDAQVRDIKGRRSRGERVKGLAEEFGVCRDQISNICRGKQRAA